MSGELDDRVGAGELRCYFLVMKAINRRLAKGLVPNPYDIDEMEGLLRDTKQKALKRRLGESLPSLSALKRTPAWEGSEAFYATRDDGETRTGGLYLPQKSVGRSACPHPFGSRQRKEWLRGWNRAWQINFE